MNWRNGDYQLSDNRGAVHLPTVHALLAHTYWAATRPPKLTEIAVENSLCFSLWTRVNQVGFARVMSDDAVYAVLLDVVIAPEHCGKGLGRWMIETIKAHPQIKGQRLVLWTTDEVKFYEAAGFTHEEAFKFLGLKPDWDAVSARKRKG